MSEIIARKHYEDGKYHYGAFTIPAPELGQLFRITATGNGSLPNGPPNPSIDDEHEAWLNSLRQNGFDVRIVPILESTT